MAPEDASLNLVVHPNHHGSLAQCKSPRFLPGEMRVQVLHGPPNPIARSVSGKLPPSQGGTDGSIPSRATSNAALAQRMRARLCDGRGRGFESLKPHQLDSGGPTIRREALPLEMSVRFAPGAPHPGSSMAERRPPNPTTMVRFLAGVPTHACLVAQWQSHGLICRGRQFDSDRDDQSTAA